MKKYLIAFAIALSFVTFPFLMVSAVGLTYEAELAFENIYPTPWEFKYALTNQKEYIPLEFMYDGWYHEYYQNGYVGAWVSCDEEKGSSYISGIAGMNGDPIIAFVAPEDGKIKIPSFRVLRDVRDRDGIRIQILRNKAMVFPQKEEWFEIGGFTKEFETPEILLEIEEEDVLYLRISGNDLRPDIFDIVDYQIQYLSDSEYEAQMEKEGVVVVPGKERETYFGFDGFFKRNIYTNQFEDVSATDWYAEGVKTAYELGLVNGTSLNTFNPKGQITNAEMIALACRIHNIYFGNQTVFSSEGSWYLPYMEYAIENGIIREGQFEAYDDLANRASFAVVFANALPDEAFPLINDITEIPDISLEEWYSEAVYKLYRAGILAGNDSYGNFSPFSNIQRSEVATIITRMAEKAKRKQFSLQVKVQNVQIEGNGAIIVGETASWSAIVSPDNSNQVVVWKSENPEIATVDKNGYVYGVSVGTTNITAIAEDGISSSSSVTVYAKPEGYYYGTAIPNYTSVTGVAHEGYLTLDTGGYMYIYPYTHNGTNSEMVDYLKYLLDTGWIALWQQQKGYDYIYMFESDYDSVIVIYDTKNNQVVIGT